MTAPATFQFFEGEGPLYAVTVSAQRSRGGRALLHTFAYRVQAEIGGLAYGDTSNSWVVATPPTKKQINYADQRRGITRMEAVTERRIGGGEQGNDLTAAQFVDEEASIHLVPGVDVHPAVLSHILNALRNDNRHEIDIDDVKVVVSQLASRIRKLDSLLDDERRRAAAALYVEILKRCTKI